MIDRLLAIIAPYHCCGCDQTGSILCDCCKNDVFDEAFSMCIFCINIVKNASLCSNHTLPYQQAFCCGFRESLLDKLIDALKFRGCREAAHALATLLHDQLPCIETSITLVPVPTTAKNIRLRGYDHIELIVRELAAMRKWKVERVLVRQNNITQHFAPSAAVRKQQAKTFFAPRHALDEKKTYLLVDDIYTTGATLSAAASCLRDAGAQMIWVAALSRQKVSSEPSDDDKQSRG